jgi:hypothetical protein
VNAPSLQEREASGRGAASLTRFLEPVLLIVLGSAGVVDGWRIITTKAETPGGVEAGGWIAALGAMLVAGACVQIARDILRGPEAASATEPDVLFKPPAIALVLLLLYVALITPLGYVLATALFVAAYLRIFGRYGPLTVAAIAIPFAAGSGWLWSALNMTLPQGVLPWP